MGAASDNIASAKRNPVQTGNRLLLRRRRRRRLLLLIVGDASQGKTRVLGSFCYYLHGTNRDKRCRRERHGSSESLGSAVSGFRPWSATDGTVRGPRSMAPCVSRERHGSKGCCQIFFDDYIEQIEINGAGGSVTVVRAVSGFRACSERGPCVGRDRWHRAWPARDLNAKTLSTQNIRS